ncbi:GLPGLI family protein [Salinimicrobium sp. GXAS 041]|uniref:GLPGLI family protein n=1 Tax=Salinimicrobium sp. GXAS 041 TaxID=3400806 RepID=UPI003C70D321
MNKIILIIFTLTTCIGHSQTNTGTVHYGEIQSMGMGAPVGTDMRGVLIFDNTRSLYITRQDSLEGGHISEQRKYSTSSGGGFSKTVSTNQLGFRYYNDLKGKKFYSRDLGFMYVKEETPKIRWEMSKETKLIGEHTAKKATTEFRGRKYTAWFTTDIPLPYGPWKLQGLPGLILEAYDTNKEIYWYFKTLEYPSKHGHLLKPIENKSGWVNQQEYAKTLFEAWKNAQVGGRMVAESIGVSRQERPNTSMLRTYIEDFSR